MGLIKTMPIGQDKTRVGIITYNSDVSLFRFVKFKKKTFTKISKILKL